MSNQTDQCQKCGGGSEWPLCWSCVPKLRRLLLDILDVIDELEIQVTRQSVGARSVGSSGHDEQPVLFDEAAQDALDHLLETLKPWCVEVTEHRFTISGSIDRSSLGRFFVKLLLHSVVQLSRNERAGTAFQELRLAHSKALAAVDRQRQKIALGTCGCGRPVHAREGALIVTCSCGREFDVQGSREQTRAWTEDYLITANQAVDLGEIGSKRFNASTIRSWVRRQRLNARGTDPTSGEALYRYGDLLGLLSQ
ncbi:hypothetical protein [Nocardia sp. NPDC057440]|uniref:hypothetical protein n=1 Tax=Nocardia sp. NPDC057440 TaxID=3346134 RepID=UPI003672250D